MFDRSTSRLSQIWRKFRDKEYRDSFVSADISATLAAQVYALRERRGWTQKQLADTTGMAQARISLLEDPSYDKQTLTTLKRLASAFDVGLMVRFVPLSEQLRRTVEGVTEALEVTDFGRDALGQIPTAEPAAGLKEPEANQLTMSASPASPIVFRLAEGAASAGSESATLEQVSFNMAGVGMVAHTSGQMPMIVAAGSPFSTRQVSGGFAMRVN